MRRPAQATVAQAAILIAALLTSAPAQANLLQNGSFEDPGSTNTAAWAWEYGNPDANGGTWGSAARVDWRAFGGTWEGAIRGTWAEAGDGGGFWQQQPCLPQTDYRARAWFWADSDWNCQRQGFAIEFYDAAQGWLGAVSNVLTDLSDAWVEKQVRAQSPSNAAFVRVVVAVDQAAHGGSLQFDVLGLQPHDANLLENTSFEEQGSTTNAALFWELNNAMRHGGYWGSMRRVNWRAHSGAWEGAIAGQWAGAGDYGGTWQEQACTPGSNYHWSAWFWADTTWSATLQGLKIEFYDATTSLVASVSNAWDGAQDDWVYRHVEAVAPPAAEWVRAVIWAEGAGQEGSLQFDDGFLGEQVAAPRALCLVIW